MEKKISIRQMNALYGAIQKMGESGVSVKGLGMCDLAMDKALIEPMIIAYEKLRQPSDRISQYNLKISMVPIEERSNVIAEFATDLEAHRMKELEIAGDFDKEKTVDLVMIKKANLIIDEKNGKAAEVLFGLLPIIEQ